MDDDDNLYVDDVDGAGVMRAGDLEAAATSASARPAAQSAASLALRVRPPIMARSSRRSPRGWDIRRNGGISVGLPRLVFFRLLGDVCKPTPRLMATEADLYSAMDYVFERAPILVLSYTMTGALSPAFGSVTLHSSDFTPDHRAR